MKHRHQSGALSVEGFPGVLPTKSTADHSGWALVPYQRNLLAENRNFDWMKSMLKCSHKVVMIALMFSPAINLFAASPQDLPVNETSTTVATGFVKPGDWQPPSVVIHPSQVAGEALNQCSYELLPRTGGADAGYLLRLQVPESVKSIELIPVAETSKQRNFQLRLDELDADPVMKTVSTQKKVVRGWRTVEDLLPEGNAVAPANDIQPGSRFKANPFFKADPDHQASRPSIPDSEPEMDVAQSVDRARPLPTNPPYDPRLTTTADKPVNSAVSWIHLGDDMVADESMSSHIESVIPSMAPLSDQVADEMAPRMLGPVEATQQASVSLEVQGPTTMDVAGTADFMISISNQSDYDLVEFDVRLTMPDGLAITVYDREAEVDLDSRSYRWRIPRLSARGNQTIQYRVHCQNPGLQTQQVEVGYDGQFQPLTSIATEAIEAAASVSVLQR